MRWLPADWRKTLLLAVALLLLATIHLSVARFAGNQEVVGDGIWYAELSKNNPLELGFWTDARPGFYPFLMKVLGSRLYAFQWILYFLACCLAAWVIVVSARTLMAAIVSCVLLVLVTSSQNYIFWGGFALTESYTLSCCLILASLSLLADKSAWVWPPILIVLSTMVLVRDVNLYLSIAFLGLVGLSNTRALLSLSSSTFRPQSWVRQNRPMAWFRFGAIVTTAVLLFLALGITWHSQRANYRYLTNLQNVIQMRMMPDAGARAYLADHGLTIGPLLATRAHKPAWEDQANNGAPEMQAYGEWMRKHGLTAYEQFLLAHPTFLLASLLEDRPEITPGSTSLLDDMGLPSLLNLHSWQGFYPIGSSFGGSLHPSWANWISSIPITWPGFLIMLAFASYWAVMGWRSGEADALACLGISTLPTLIVSNLADAWDVWRHGLPFIFLAQMCAVAFIGRLVDFALTRTAPYPLRQHC